MFRQMRRSEKQISDEKAEKILRKATYGILGVNGDNGYPYTIPVNFAYCDGKLYIHSTSAGSHKIDSIRQNDKVSFCVIGEETLIPEKLDNLYESVVIFGKAKILEKKEDREEAVKILINKVCPQLSPQAKEILEKQDSQVTLVEIQIEHMTGKKGE